MSEPLWLTAEIVSAIHDEQLLIHGGSAGTRDAGLLASALDWPKNKWSYEGAGLPALAAAYAFGIARNHPYVDGNKRTALLAIYTFLGLNDVDFVVPEAEAAAIVLSLAAGELGEDDLAKWIEAHLSENPGKRERKSGSKAKKPPSRRPKR